MDLLMLPIVIGLSIFLLSITVPIIYSGQYAHTLEHRWNKVVKPTLGGLFFFIALVTWLLWALSVVNSKQEVFNIGSLGMASSIAFIIGWLDDRFGTDPLPKLMGQVLVTSVLLVGDWILPLSGNTLIDSIVTLVWVVALQNAFNFFDNMDGVTGIASLILFFLMIFIPIDLVYKLMFLFLSLALLGFLFHNFPPSRIYMGDKGSLLLGTIASITPILLCQSGCGHLNWVEKLFMFTVFVGLPAIDIILVVIHRICRKTPPWVGGTDHLSHSLHSFLGSERKVVITVALLQIILVVPAGIALWLSDATLIVSTMIMWIIMFFILIIVHWRYVPEPYNSLCYKHTTRKMPPFLRRLLTRCEGNPC